MSQPNETTPKRAQRNSQPRTAATTSAAAAVPQTARATAANRRSMQPPAQTINPDPRPSAAARSGPQAKSPATTKRGSRAATGGPSNPVARPKERQMMWMLQKYQKCLALAQRKMCRRISTSPIPTPTPTPIPPPPPPPAAAPLQQSAVVQLSAPPHIRTMSGKEYAAVSMMRSAAVHNPLLVSRALETVIDQQGPSRTTTTTKRGDATNKSSSGGQKKRGGGEDEGEDEEENVIVLDNIEDELQGSSSTAKKRRVMNKSADDNMAVAAELPLQIIMPTPPNSSHEEDQEAEKTTVEGFIYHDEDDDEDEQASIIACSCHGMIFLTPADFIKHAGGTADAFNPIKRISITVTHLPN